MPVVEINEKHYLGSLCKQGHNYQNSGMSLRYKKGLVCVVCQLMRTSKYIQNNRKKTLEYHRSYRERYKVKLAEYQRRYRAKNRGKISKDEVIKRNSLSDTYIKKILRCRQGLNSSEATPELIILKRSIVLFKRELKKNKEVANGLFSPKL